MDNDKPKRKNRPGGGRPFKMKIWIEVLKEVLSENEVVYLTNEDLVFLVNDKIENTDSQITVRTFKNWIAGKFHPEEEIGKEFMGLIKKALIRQKQALAKKMLEGDDKYWYKYGWLLERKFSEYNLKSISEVKNTNEQQNIILITAANDEQKNLIDNIINVDFVEVKPLQFTSPDDNMRDEYDF